MTRPMRSLMDSLFSHDASLGLALAVLLFRCPLACLFMPSEPSKVDQLKHQLAADFVSMLSEASWPCAMALEPDRITIMIMTIFVTVVKAR